MEEKKEIITGSPVTVADLSLIPILETRLHRWKYRKSFSVLGSKQVIGIVIVTPTTKKALKVSGQEVTPDELREEFPELEIKLGSQ